MAKITKAIFLDRDGVINQCPPFVNKPDDLIILPQVPEALERLKKSGYAIHVVSNQGGIGLGYMQPHEMTNINRRTLELLPMINSIEYCPHKPDDNCDCRKPKGKMIKDLIDLKGYNVEKCWMLGDMITDVQAGLNAGLTRERCVKVNANTNALWIITGYILVRDNYRWRERNGKKKKCGTKSATKTTPNSSTGEQTEKQ